MSNSELIGAYAGWEIGDDGWWNLLKNKFDELEELDQEFQQNN